MRIKNFNEETKLGRVYVFYYGVTLLSGQLELELSNSASSRFLGLWFTWIVPEMNCITDLR